MIFDPYFMELTAVKLMTGIVIGLVLGSFITMLSYRLPRGISIITPRSTCPNCKTVLDAMDLIPLFSWLLSGGKCRHCHKKIGGRYILIELATTTLTATAFTLIGFHLFLLPALALLIAAMTFVTIQIEKIQAKR